MHNIMYAYRLMRTRSKLIMQQGHDKIVFGVADQGIKITLCFQFLVEYYQHLGYTWGWGFIGESLRFIRFQAGILANDRYMWR